MKRFFLLLFLLPVLAHGAIVRTQNVSATATSVAITSTAANDIIVVFSYNGTSGTIPSVPAGFTNISSGVVSTNAIRLGYKISAGGDTSSGTWTNATAVACLVYSGAGGIGALAGGGNGTGTGLTYNAITLSTKDGTSIVVAGGGATAATAGMNGNPTGTAPNLTNRTSQTTINALDTAAIATNFTSQTLTVTGSGRWLTGGCELKARTSGNFLQMFLKR